MANWIKKHSLLLLQVLLLALGVAGGVYTAVAPANSLMRWYNIDDAFYYYKVAQNVLTGHGFTFDQINPTNGFHPLWMAVCLGVFWLSKYNLVLPLRVLVLVSALLNAFTGVFLFRLLRKALRTPAAFIGALTWILLPAIYGTTIVHGMETAISAFFMVLYLLDASTLLAAAGLRRLHWWQYILLGLLGALTILARLDNVFVVASVGMFLLLRVRQIKLDVFLDLVLVALAGFASWLIRLGLPAYEFESRSIYPMVALGLLLKPIAYFFVGLYQPSGGKKFFRLLEKVILASVVALAAQFALLALLNRLGLLATVSKSILLVDAALCMALVLGHHLLTRSATSEQGNSPWQTFTYWLARSWRHILAEGFLFALPVAVLVGCYVVLNKIFFGTFTPVSGQIKTWWSTFPNTIYGHKISLLTVLGLNPESNYGPWSLVTSQLFGFAEKLDGWFGWANDRSVAILFAVLFTAASVLVLLALNQRHGNLAKKAFSFFLPALMLGATIQVMYYVTIGYQHTRSWYWAAQMLSLVLLGALLIEGFHLWMRAKPGRRLVAAVVFAGMILYIVVLHGNYVYSLVPQQVAAQQQGEYLTEVHQLEAKTEKGSLIGMTGGGNIAYFIQDRTVINLDGLINSADYFHAMKSGTAQQWLDALPLDYAFGKGYTLTVSDPYNAFLANRLEKIVEINGPEMFTLFKYVVKK